MLKSCFHGDISPGLAEDIVIKQKLYSYLVRQSDRDPSRLVLTFHDGEPKHVIIPDFGTKDAEILTLRAELRAKKKCGF